MKTIEIETNGQTYRINAVDGKITVEQHNSNQAIGREWQSVARAAYANGVVTSLRGLAWDNAELLAAADKIAAE